MVSKDGLTKFQQLYKKHFGKELNQAEALEYAIKLIELIKIIYKPMTEGDFKKVQEYRKNHNLM